MMWSMLYLYFAVKMSYSYIDRQSIHDTVLRQCPDGEIGIHIGLKSRQPQGYAGSTPARGTTAQLAKLVDAQSSNLCSNCGVPVRPRRWAPTIKKRPLGLFFLFPQGISSAKPR